VRVSDYFPVRRSVADQLDDYIKTNPQFGQGFELLKNSHILGATACSQMFSIGQDLGSNAGMVDNKDGVPEMAILSHIEVDDGFPATMGMQLAAGRDFSHLLLTDIGKNFLVNETLVKRRGEKSGFVSTWVASFSGGQKTHDAPAAVVNRAGD